MSLPQFDTSELIDNIKRRCAVPTSQLTYTSAQFAALANDVLQDVIVPIIMSTREEYFVTSVDVVVPTDGIVDFPSAAIGAKLRSVCVVQQSNPMVLNNVPRLDLDVIAGINTMYGNGYGYGFYIEGNKLKFYPSTGGIAGQTVRIYYYNRTLALAAPADYGKITAIDTNTNIVTMSRIPSSWVVGDTVNSVASQPNFALTNTDSDVEIVSMSYPDVELTSVAGMAVGDFLCFEGYSAVPQVPVEAHGYLAQLTAAKCLEGLGDREGMAAALKNAEPIHQGLMTVVSQRVDGSVKKVINPTGGIRLASRINLFNRR